MLDSAALDVLERVVVLTFELLAVDADVVIFGADSDDELLSDEDHTELDTDLVHSHSDESVSEYIVELVLEFELELVVTLVIGSVS